MCALFTFHEVSEFLLPKILQLRAPVCVYAPHDETRTLKCQLQAQPGTPGTETWHTENQADKDKVRYVKIPKSASLGQVTSCRGDQTNPHIP